ncbi:DUF1819 family protein [Robertkochia sediminum]|uniref:DUF1819 family protein n=1 Tax=Robertkochia sediminum TaxID=2785326 RepID=UPI001931ED19|nr:DUF1819 family protein [Robertkochia sediminum]MBL7471377.1 DUF1819 family protein [Robertkochia sediminum]
MIEEKPYSFGFTAASLRTKEFRTTIEMITAGKQDQLASALGGGKSTTGKRMALELTKRAQQLSPEQMEYFLNTGLDEQNAMAFYAVCKAHHFIRDFMIEVVREKTFVYDTVLTEGEFITFLRTKAELHPEIESLADSTRQKIRQVTFNMMAESGLIDNRNDKNIAPQFLGPELRAQIAADHPSWLKVLLLSDAEIKEYQ